MYLELSEAEAHVLILKGLGMHEDVQLKKRGDLHTLQSPHAIRIHDYGEEGSIFREPLSPPPEEVPDDCFVVDGMPDMSGQEFEEDLDGT